MNQYKAGDFTSGKMNEIFKCASGVFSDGARINHKQLGDFNLICDRSLEIVKNSILSNIYGVFQSDNNGKYKSCFSFINIPDDCDDNDSSNGRYFLEHFKDNFAENMVFSFYILHLFRDSLHRNSVVDMVTIASLKQETRDESWLGNFTYDVDFKLLELLGLDKSKENKDLVGGVIGVMFQILVIKVIDNICIDQLSMPTTSDIKNAAFSFLELVGEDGMIPREYDILSSNFDFIFSILMKLESCFIFDNDGVIGFRTTEV